MRKLGPQWLVCFIGVLLGACATFPQKGGDRATLIDTSQQCRQLLRWGEVDRVVAACVAPRAAELFHARYSERARDRQTTEIVVRRVDFQPEESRILVEETFYSDRDTRVRTQEFEEEWVWEDGRWMLLSREVRVRSQEKLGTKSTQK